MQWTKTKSVFWLGTRLQCRVNHVGLSQAGGQAVDQMGQRLFVQPGIFVKQLSLLLNQQHTRGDAN